MACVLIWLVRWFFSALTGHIAQFALIGQMASILIWLVRGFFSALTGHITQSAQIGQMASILTWLVRWFFNAPIGHMAQSALIGQTTYLKLIFETLLTFCIHTAIYTLWERSYLKNFNCVLHKAVMLLSCITLTNVLAHNPSLHHSAVFSLDFKYWLSHNSALTSKWHSNNLRPKLILHVRMSFPSQWWMSLCSWIMILCVMLTLR